MRLRDGFACTVMAVERQGIHLPNPDPNTVFFPNDTVLLVGREKDLRSAEHWLNTAENPEVIQEHESELGALGLLPLSVPLESSSSGICGI